MAKAKLQNARAADGERIDPVQHWFAQESDAQDRALDADIDLLLGEQRMPSGWWILPVLVMAIPLWGFLIVMLLRE